MISYTDGFINAPEYGRDGDSLFNGEDLRLPQDKGCGPVASAGIRPTQADGTHGMFYGMGDSDNDMYINIWDVDSNDQFAPGEGCYDSNVSTPDGDDHFGVFTVMRTTDLTYSSGQIAIDTNALYGASAGSWVNLTLNMERLSHEGNWYALDLDTYHYMYYTDVAGDNLIQMGVYFNARGLPRDDTTCVMIDPPGEDAIAVYYSTSDSNIYVEMSNGSYAVYGYEGNYYSGFEANLTFESVYPYNGSYGGSAIPRSADNYIVDHRESYDGRPAVNLDMDFDGIENGLELIYGLNPADADTDNDGVIDGREKDWCEDTDGDG